MPIDTWSDAGFPDVTMLDWGRAVFAILKAGTERRYYLTAFDRGLVGYQSKEEWLAEHPITEFLDIETPRTVDQNILMQLWYCTPNRVRENENLYLWNEGSDFVVEQGWQEKYLPELAGTDGEIYIYPFHYPSTNLTGLSCYNAVWLNQFYNYQKHSLYFRSAEGKWLGYTYYPEAHEGKHYKVFLSNDCLTLLDRLFIWESKLCYAPNLGGIQVGTHVETFPGPEVWTNNAGDNLYNWYALIHAVPKSSGWIEGVI